MIRHADLLPGDLSTIVVQPVSNFVVSDSIGLARRYALRAADAIHLATAARVSHASVIQTIFVTSDKELLRAARGEQLETLDPQDPEATGQLRQFHKESSSDITYQVREILCFAMEEAEVDVFADPNHAISAINDGLLAWEVTLTVAA